jgi:hypothetical protein
VVAAAAGLNTPADGLKFPAVADIPEAYGTKGFAATAAFGVNAVALTDGVHGAAVTFG